MFGGGESEHGAGEAAVGVACKLLDRGVLPDEMELAERAALDETAPRASMGTHDVLLVVHLGGPRELLAAEEALVTELATAAGATQVAPPLVEKWLRPRKEASGETGQNTDERATRRAQEESSSSEAARFVSTAELAAAWRSRGGPARFVGFHAAGAALVSVGGAGPGRAPAPTSATNGFRAELRRRLDPNGLLGGLHGAHGAQHGPAGGRREGT